MSNRKQERKIFEEETNILHEDFLTGEVKGEQRIRRTVIAQRGSDEPDFIKLYLNTIAVLNNLSITISPILLAILQRSTYADDVENGGQIFYAIKPITERIAKETGKSINMIQKNIKELVNAGCLVKIQKATYLVNPNIFGKGDWKDIKKLRMEFSVAIERDSSGHNRPLELNESSTTF